MSSDWYLINKPPIYLSGEEYNDNVDGFMQDGLSELLADGTLSSLVDICDSNLNVVAQINAVVQNNLADSVENAKTRQIISSIGSFYSGCYIRHKNELYIVASKPDNNKFYEKAVMKQCNIQLRWQNRKGETLSRWCYGSNATKYSSGVNITKLITTPDLQYNLIIPIDSETIVLQRDKRFLVEDERFSENLRANGINPQAFKLTQVDTKSDSFANIGGILNLTLIEDAFNITTDNVALMIADYFSPTPQPVGNAEITYTGEAIVKLGLSKVFTAVFKDAEGNKINGITPVWNLSLLPDQENKVTFVTEGDFITISVINDSVLTKSGNNQFVLSLEDENNLYNSELTIEIRGLFG